jgi:hypothetical protein
MSGSASASDITMTSVKITWETSGLDTPLELTIYGDPSYDNLDLNASGSIVITNLLPGNTYLLRFFDLHEVEFTSFYFTTLPAISFGLTWFYSP